MSLRRRVTNGKNVANMDLADSVERDRMVRPGDIVGLSAVSGSSSAVVAVAGKESPAAAAVVDDVADAAVGAASQLVVDGIAADLDVVVERSEEKSHVEERE